MYTLLNENIYKCTHACLNKTVIHSCTCKCTYFSITMQYMLQMYTLLNENAVYIFMYKCLNQTAIHFMYMYIILNYNAIYFMCIYVTNVHTSL